MDKSSPAIRFLKLRPDADTDIPMPRYMTPLAAGMDICAAMKNKTTLAPGAVSLIPTGFAMALPPGFEAQIRPRSGLAVKHGISIVNAPGTIDADYRGEVKIALINLGSADYTVRRGERIAQMIIQKVYQARLVITDKLDETDRSSGGFGHTGK